MSQIYVDTIKNRTGGAPTLSQGVVVSAAATFSGNVSIAGTLSYEDVTNVDAVGIITARSGIVVTGSGATISQLTVSGVSTFAGITTVTGPTLFTKQLNASGVSTFVSGPVVIGAATTTGITSQSLQVTGGGYVSGSLGVGVTNPTAGFSCLTYGTDLFSTSQVYYSPSGRAHMLFGEASSGTDIWVGFKGTYGATSGSVNILLQTNFQDTSQHAGGYISNEALSATTSATCFGFLTGGATTSTRPSKTERMRIRNDPDNLVLIGQSSNPATSTLCIAVRTGTANGVNAQITSNTGTSYPWSNYNASGTYVGGISCTSTATSFPTSSDYRLKQNVQPLVNAAALVAQLKPSTFEFKEDAGKQVQGFIAHELQEVVPLAVIGEKDAEDANGNPIYQGVDAAKLVPLLTAALQEAIAKIETLEARLTVAGI